MGKLAEAYVDIEPNLQPLESGLGQAGGMLRGFTQAGAGFFTGMASALTAVTVAAAGVATIGRGLFEAAKKGSDLGETLSKVKVTFGDAAKDMMSQADTLASKYGVIKRESLDAAASFGLMGVAAGLSRTAAADLGQEFVQLGLDAASYFNVSNEEAFEKLRSGLAGETEPLRAFGVLLSEDAVKAEALAMGLVKTNRELTEQEKVLARASAIKKGLTPSHGDLERTADSAANQLRKVEGEIENLETELGEKLVPALSSAINVAHNLGETFEKTFGTGPVDAFTKALNDLGVYFDAWTGGEKRVAEMLVGGAFPGSKPMPSKEELEKLQQEWVKKEPERRARAKADAVEKERRDALGAAYAAPIPDKEIDAEIMARGFIKDSRKITPADRARVARQMQEERDAATAERFRNPEGPAAFGAAEIGADQRDRANQLLRRGRNLIGQAVGTALSLPGPGDVLQFGAHALGMGLHAGQAAINGLNATPRRRLAGGRLGAFAENAVPGVQGHTVGRGVDVAGGWTHEQFLAAQAQADAEGRKPSERARAERARLIARRRRRGRLSPADEERVAIAGAHANAGPSQAYGGIEDYARASIEAALGSKDKVPEKIDQTNDELANVKTSIDNAGAALSRLLSQLFGGGIKVA